MKIAAKVGLSLLAVFLVVLAFLSGLLSSHGAEHLAAVEEERTQGAVRRLQDLIRYQAESLLAYAIDIACWDATCNFMASGEPDRAYLESDLPDESMGIDFVLFYDAGDRLYHGEVLDGRGTGHLEELKEEVENLLPALREGERNLSGLLRLDNGVALTAFSPIRNSRSEKEDRGTLVLARLIDDEIPQLSLLTGLSLNLTPLNDGTDGENRALTRRLLAEPGRPLIKRRKDDVTATTLLFDLQGRPAFLASIRLASDLRSRYKADAVGLIASLTVAFLALLTASFVLFHRLVLVRLQRVRGEMERIAASPHLQGQLTEEGGDEMADLARRGNALITALVEARNSERRTSQLFRSLVDNIPGIVYRSRDDANWTKEYLNGAFEELTGYGVTEFLLNEERSFAEIIHPDDRNAVREGAKLCRNERRPFALTYRILRRDGSIRWVFDKGQFLYDPTASAFWFDGVILDITERKKLEEQLLHLSLHDGLTGLYNRTFFEEQAALYEDGRYDPLAVVTIDVDGLKTVNDALGHGAGDDLLRRAASVLRRSFRDSDIIARCGGDEFFVLLPHCSAPGLRLVLERLNDALEAAVDDGATAPLFLSVGWAWRERGGRTLAQLIADADNAMYRSKAAHSGRMAARFRKNIETLLEKRDGLDDGHQRRLTLILDALADGLKLEGAHRHRLALLARYHDLGKAAVNDEIDERRHHADVGARIARIWPDLAPLAEAIGSHHERWDGRGRPQGLTGDAIPLEARLLAVALAYEERRSGRKGSPLGTLEALAEIEAESGKAFDPAVVDAFLGLDAASLDRAFDVVLSPAEKAATIDIFHKEGSP